MDFIMRNGKYISLQRNNFYPNQYKVFTSMYQDNKQCGFTIVWESDSYSDKSDRDELVSDILWELTHKPGIIQAVEFPCTDSVIDDFLRGRSVDRYESILSDIMAERDLKPSDVAQLAHIKHSDVCDILNMVKTPDIRVNWGVVNLIKLKLGCEILRKV